MHFGQRVDMGLDIFYKLTLQEHPNREHLRLEMAINPSIFCDQKSSLRPLFKTCFTHSSLNTMCVKCCTSFLLLDDTILVIRSWRSNRFLDQILVYSYYSKVLFFVTFRDTVIISQLMETKYQMILGAIFLLKAFRYAPDKDFFLVLAQLFIMLIFCNLSGHCTRGTCTQFSLHEKDYKTSF